MIRIGSAALQIAWSSWWDQAQVSLTTVPDGTGSTRKGRGPLRLPALGAVTLDRGASVRAAPAPAPTCAAFVLAALVSCYEVRAADVDLVAGYTSYGELRQNTGERIQHHVGVGILSVGSRWRGLAGAVGEYGFLGVGYRWERERLAIEGGVAYGSPSPRLRTHEQFLLTVSWRVTDRASVAWVHVSNGGLWDAPDAAGVTNRGLDGLALRWSFE